MPANYIQGFPPLDWTEQKSLLLGTMVKDDHPDGLQKLRARQFRNRLTHVFLVCGLFGAALVSVCSGAVAVTPGQIASILGERLGIALPWTYEYQHELVVISLRLPRIILGILVGGTLALSGAALQGLFRNPLADPALVGVSSGAALGAVGFIVLGGSVAGLLPEVFGPFYLPTAAFAGGLLIAVLVYRIGVVDGRTQVATMLLAGIAFNAICSALIGMFVFNSDDQQLRDLTFWTMGSLSRNTWGMLLPVFPLLLLPCVVIPLLSRSLNAYVLGESEAGHLGYNVEQLKMLTIVFTSLAIGAAVAVSGIIAFVGLVVPHLARLLLGSDHRQVLPCSLLLGAILILLADVISRTMVVPAELPIGVVTSCIGGPFFLWLLINKRMLRGI
ncbi:MAG: iron ABC transporter permease [Gammaproteobacteria bacterium]|nr:iron ABC transporter permease [Gammaproteobacteria bacterium]MCY4357807.1 iron ABC transporter permease [Gammaproteobacteria bacterium]